ncbi:hypothetical protein GQ42DRAFT_155353 [Ramicandelaber brevisporus]|nr:hypothetical protein GQ42DRAFT_155353 [Ramicandelaber brevisporus]
MTIPMYSSHHEGSSRIAERAPSIRRSASTAGGSRNKDRWGGIYTAPLMTSELETAFEKLSPGAVTPPEALDSNFSDNSSIGSTDSYNYSAFENQQSINKQQQHSQPQQQLQPQLPSQFVLPLTPASSSRDSCSSRSDSDTELDLYKVIDESDYIEFDSYMKELPIHADDHLEFDPLPPQPPQLICSLEEFFTNAANHSNLFTEQVEVIAETHHYAAEQFLLVLDIPRASRHATRAQDFLRSAHFHRHGVTKLRQLGTPCGLRDGKFPCTSHAGIQCYNIRTALFPIPGWVGHACSTSQARKFAKENTLPKHQVRFATEKNSKIDDIPHNVAVIAC